MSADDLERANRRLAGRESFTVAPSRYLGHYVAGHLASRLGVVVELHDSPAGGITARVDIPMGLLANEETDPQGSSLVDVAPPAVEEAPAPSAELPSPPPAVVPSPPLTANGLPRRGDRPQPAPEPAPSWEPAPGPEPAWEPTAPPSWRAGLGRQRSGDACLGAGLGRRRPPPSRRSPRRAGVGTNRHRSAPTPARGFGGLAVTRPSGESMYSVAADHARNGQASESAADAAPPTARAVGPTPGGLARRSPGPSDPDAAFGTTGQQTRPTPGVRVAPHVARGRVLVPVQLPVGRRPRAEPMPTPRMQLIGEHRAPRRMVNDFPRP